MQLSGYIPCYNNEQHIADAVRSLKAQELPVSDLMVVDDGSTDRSAEIAEKEGARVIRLGENLGRGAVNARAISEAKHDLVVCLGATNVLNPDFSKQVVHWFEDPSVAGVYSRIISRPSKNTVDRWRARHLFRETASSDEVRRHAILGTTGSIMRRSAVIAVGNFNINLRHTEDGELGERLLAAGWDVIADGRLKVIANGSNTLPQVLERYWRWNAGKDEGTSLKGYLKQIAFSIRTMAVKDLSAGDPASVPISLLSPHYQFWKSWLRRRP